MLIETFVFFDLETTGLPRYNTKTKITELTLLAAARRDIENTSLGNRPLISKLSMVFNPQVKIETAAAAITGLTNSMLINQPIFKNRISSINSFLEDLPKPVCLVAHNGNSFDYKILRAEYIDANETLPVDIYCVDSRWGFRKIIKDTNLCYGKIINNTLKKIDSNSITVENSEEWPELNTSVEEWQEIDQLVNSFTNMSTESLNQSTTSPTKPVSPQKHIVKGTENKGKSNNITPDKIVCTLSALYKRFLNKEAVDAHRAEADCLMLLECVVATKEYFLPWANSTCKLIQKIEPLKQR